MTKGQINYSAIVPGAIKLRQRKIGNQRPEGLIPLLSDEANTMGQQPARMPSYVGKLCYAEIPEAERSAFDGVAGFDWGIQHK
ncbi:MAG: hypothetical protein N2C12_17300 [Planctomycetales bacterium]